MPQFASQFALIDKIKTIVKKTGNIFVPNASMGISESIARKIQKSAYDATHAVEKETFSPPYLLISEQLQSRDNQIFRAAVFYLADIAVNEADNRAAIIDILSCCQSLESTTKEQQDYIKDKLEYISNSTKA